MSLILRPPWTRPPGQGARIDWSNPLARGLVLAYVPGNGEYVRGGSSIVKYGSATLGADNFNGWPTNVDLSDDTANDAVACVLPSSHPVYSITNAFTLALFARVTSATTYTNYVSFPYRGGTSWSEPYNSLVWYRSGSSSNLTLQLALTQYTNSNATTTVTPGATGVFKHVITRAGTSGKFYSNGSLAESLMFSSGSSVDWGEKRPLVLLNSSESSLPNGGYAGAAGPVFLWNRELSAAEVAAFNANPWQLFEPGRIWVPVSSGGGSGFNAAWARQRSAILGAGMR